MIVYMLFNGQAFAALILLVTIIFSLTLHEFGHAAAGTWLGDDTALRAGRLTLNPIPHIDPLGLLMVATIGFGWARPVPFNPMKIRKEWGSAMVAAAGPAMNLLIAVVVLNLAGLGKVGAIPMLGQGNVGLVLEFIGFINILLMLFNLIPLGPLDGHYVMSWLLPDQLARQYDELNGRFGSILFLALIVLSYAGVPIFSKLWALAAWVAPWITLIG